MTEKRIHFEQSAEQALGIEIGGLYDCARLVRELGITRHAAEAIMRELPKQRWPRIRKEYVRGGDLIKLLDAYRVEP